MRLMKDALATIVAQAIDEQGLSIREAGARCGIKHGLMTNIYYGRTQRPEPATLQALAEGLGVPYRTLALAAYGIPHDIETVPA